MKVITSFILTSLLLSLQACSFPNPDPGTTTMDIDMRNSAWAEFVTEPDGSIMD